MATSELHLMETAGWRALLTEAQLGANVQLPPPVEGYLIGLLFRHTGSHSPNGEPHNSLFDRMEQMFAFDSDDSRLVGDQCMMFAGVFPEHAIRKGVPIVYFVQLGRSAYRDYGLHHRSELHVLLSDWFVHAMDVMHTLRTSQIGEPCIDALNAYHLWCEQGSVHGWNVLRAMTQSLPACLPLDERIH